MPLYSDWSKERVSADGWTAGFFCAHTGEARRRRRASLFIFLSLIVMARLTSCHDRTI
jgi:hypothetical protein